MEILFDLQLVLRDNDLIELPKEIGDLTRLRELHIQGNRLTVLPPEIGMNFNYIQSQDSALNRFYHAKFTF